MTAGFRNNLVLAGIGSLAFAALAPLPTLAAPGITFQGSFNGTNGRNPVSALTAAGNGLYYGTTRFGGANGGGTIFAFDSGVRSSNPVPGPLPLMGAGAAFGWSRRLRRRIQQVRSVFPIGR
jgi:uncharacterized repeat protein (TIGR03803 family)